MNEQKFWDKVDKSAGPDECWPWLGYIGSDGYGRHSLNQKPARAHRLAWSLVNGEIPDGGLICHTCDNPVCANPSHLWLGDAKSNMQDKIAKGRQMWGGKCRRGHDLSVTAIPANGGAARRCGVCHARYQQTVKEARHAARRAVSS